MKSIDFKSLLIGILGTALVMVLMGQSKIEKQYDVECVAFIDPKVRYQDGRSVEGEVDLTERVIPSPKLPHF